MTIAVTEEAIKAEFELARKLKQMQDDLIRNAEKLLSSFEENKSGLGAHADELNNLLETLRKLTIGTPDLCLKKLIRRLNLSAKNRQMHLDSSIYKENIAQKESSSTVKVSPRSNITVIPVRPIEFSQSGAVIGWCPKSNMRAVSFNSKGQKTVRIPIGEKVTVFNCSLAGIEKAYSSAIESGDADLIRRVSAMYEIESFRNTIDLGRGDPGYAQLGGYHKDVKVQCPKGYESHHIPARSVQAEKADRLPALAITKEDHKLTSSYSGKQRHRFHSVFPDDKSTLTYKEEVSKTIAEGGSGYVRAVINELYDLKNCVGDRYDGAIAAFLDAIIDLLASDGIPEAK